VLNEGDVLEVFTQAKAGTPDTSDLTGTRVTVDKPVQVIGGHKCTNIPHNVTFCDHLEESIPPIETLRRSTSSPAADQRRNTQGADGPHRRHRAEHDADLRPAAERRAGPCVKAGDYAEIAADAERLQDHRRQEDPGRPVHARAERRRQLGRPGDGPRGATEQYRKSTCARADQLRHQLRQHGRPARRQRHPRRQPVAGFTPIGATGFGVARIQLSNNGDGNHDCPVGDSRSASASTGTASTPATGTPAASTSTC
jgi:hypothetical protein